MSRGVLNYKLYKMSKKYFNKINSRYLKLSRHKIIKYYKKITEIALFEENNFNCIFGIHIFF